jgi:hypothetical protein
MSNSHTELYQAAPFLQQGRVCNIVPNHAQFYSHPSSFQPQTFNYIEHTPSILNHLSSSAMPQPLVQQQFSGAVVDEGICSEGNLSPSKNDIQNNSMSDIMPSSETCATTASKLDCSSLYKNMERKAHIILNSTKSIENTAVDLGEHKNKPAKKKRNPLITYSPHQKY